MESKTDKIIWYLMATFITLFIMAAAAWAAQMSGKVERISTLEVNVQYIQRDISDIKDIIKKSLKGGYR